MINVRTTYSSPTLSVDQIDNILRQVIAESNIAQNIQDKIVSNKMQIEKNGNELITNAFYSDLIEIDNEWINHLDEIETMRQKISSFNIFYAKEILQA